jgi:hypothetical protein
MKDSRGLRLGLLAVALSVVLFGCSGDDGESSVPTTRPSTTAGPPETTTSTAVVAPSTTTEQVVPSTTPPVEPATKRFVSAKYKVDLRIPSDWTEPDESRGAQPPFFFLVSAADNSGGPLSDFCQTEASHRLRPYGSTPTVSDVSVDGQPGCVIEPSDDQPVEMRGMGELVVRYPTPVQLDSGEYGLFVMYARVPELRTIASSVTFTA